MKRLLFLLLLLLIGCRNRSSIADNAGWKQVTVRVSNEVSQKVLNALPSQYYKSNQEYKYFALRFLKPLSNGETPVVLETSRGGLEWVRLFTFRDDQLKFMCEAEGAVTKVEHDDGTIRLIIDESNFIVLVTG